MVDWAYTFAGLVVGFLVGLTGVGGGSLMTPLLVFIFNVSPMVAVGTDLLFASLTKAGGIWVHNRRKTIQWQIVGLLALGSLPAALLTIAVLKMISADIKQMNQIITTGLGVALILTSIALIFKQKLHRLGEKTLHSHPHWARWRTASTVIAGIILGVLVTMTSVGAGALGAAILFFLYPHIRSVEIVGTDIAHAVPLTAIAGLGHLHLGTVDMSLLISLLLGSLPGIYIGSHLSANIPERVMRPILASMLMLIGFKMVW